MGCVRARVPTGNSALRLHAFARGGRSSRRREGPSLPGARLRLSRSATASSSVKKGLAARNSRCSRRKSHVRATSRSPKLQETPAREVASASRKRCREEPQRPPGTRPRASFLWGLPSAGKSTEKRRRLRRGEIDIAPDRYKTSHRAYSRDMGEDTDDEVHHWSVQHADKELDKALAEPEAEQRDLVFDSGGSNAARLREQISAARRAGYATELLWVDVPVDVSLFRNRNRDVCDRSCCEKLIIQRSTQMRRHFEELAGLVDDASQVRGWDESSREAERAALDLHLYPAPRDRPPSVRPGSSRYGEAPSGARSPSRTRSSRRNLRIGPWKRNDEVMRKKAARLAWMDRTYRGDRSRFVLEEVLCGRDIYLEPNAYPYHLPPGGEHWTLWAFRSMRDRELIKYVEAWLDSHKPHNVVSWNYDDNRGRRTIDIWHVHIYFMGADGKPPFESPGAGRMPSLSSSSRPRRSPASV